MTYQMYLTLVILSCQLFLEVGIIMFSFLKFVRR